MLKYLNIIFMLTLVVVVSSLAVYFTDEYTAPLIEAILIEEANAAKFEVLPELTTDGLLNATDGSTTYQSGMSTASIDELLVIDGVGYLYTASFKGYDSTIRYIIGIDLDGNLTGFKVLEQGDSPGFGAEIVQPSYATQFVGMTAEDVVAGNIDAIAGTSGAPITTGALKTSMAKVVNFHLSTFSGVVQETEEEKLLRYKEEITQEGATFTTFTPDVDFGTSGIIKAEYANDGSSNFAVIYTVVFKGYAEGNEYLISFDLATHDVLGFRVTNAADSVGIGGEITKQDFMDQFAGLAQEDVQNGDFDAIASASNQGAPITRAGLETSLDKVVRYHNAEFQGIFDETLQERFLRVLKNMYPTYTSYVDVTRNYPADYDIEGIYEVYEDTTLLGVYYVTDFVGASVQELTYIKLLIGIDVENVVVGVDMYDNTDTPLYVANITAAALAVANGTNVLTEDLLIDSVANATLTSAAINAGLANVKAYHENNYAVRPEPVAVTNAELLNIYPLAASFTSIYLDEEFNGSILNIYEAKDGSDQTIGYVYYTKASGKAVTPITFLWGIDVTGATSNVYVVAHAETWSEAYEYSGSLGYFPTTSWLDEAVGLNVNTAVVQSDIDTISGVTVTTQGMINAFDLVITYHTTILGGAQ